MTNQNGPDKKPATPIWMQLLQIAQTLGIVAAFWSLYVTLDRFKADYDWNRKQYAATVLSAFTERNSPHRAAIIAKVPEIDDIKDNPVKLQKWYEDLLNNKAKDAIDLKDHILAMLNIFEDVSLAWHYKIANEEILDAEIGAAVTRWHAVLKPFENAFHAQNPDLQGSPWPSFDDYANYLDLKKAQKESRPPAPTIGR